MRLGDVLCERLQVMWQCDNSLWYSHGLPGDGDLRVARWSQWARVV
jgi:hypothetical protein